MDETVCTECEAPLDAEGGGHKIRCSEHPANKTSYGIGSVIPDSEEGRIFQTAPPVRGLFATPSIVAEAVKKEGPMLPNPKVPEGFADAEEDTGPPPTVRPPGRASMHPTVAPLTSDVLPTRRTTVPMPEAPVTLDPMDPDAHDTDPSGVAKSERPTDPVPACQPYRRSSSPDDVTPVDSPSGLMRASKPDGSLPPFGPEQRSQSGLRLKNGVTTVPAPKADGGTDNGST